MIDKKTNKTVTIYTGKDRLVFKEICSENLCRAVLKRKGKTKDGKSFEVWEIDTMGNRNDYSGSVLKEFFEYKKQK